MRSLVPSLVQTRLSKTAEGQVYTYLYVDTHLSVNTYLYVYIHVHIRKAFYIRANIHADVSIAAT